MKLSGLKTQQNAHGESIWAVAWMATAGTGSSSSSSSSSSSAPLRLVTGSLDESVKVWDVDGDELRNVFTSAAHSLGVVSVAAHPCLPIAAATSMDCFVRVFNVDNNATIATLETPPSEAWHLCFNPAGSILAVAGGSSASVKLWQTSSLSSNSSWTSHSLVIPRDDAAPDKTGGKFVLGVAWSPDGRRLACSTMDGTIAVFDVEKNKLLCFLEGHLMPVRSLAFSPVDPNVLFSASDDKHIHMYDVQRKGLLCAMSGHSSWVLSIDVSPDGSAIASGSSDRTVKLWDISMRAPVQTMSNHSDQVWGVAFWSAGGHGTKSGRLVSVSDDKSISLYDFN